MKKNKELIKTKFLKKHLNIDLDEIEVKEIRIIKSGGVLAELVIEKHGIFIKEVRGYFIKF